MKNLYLVFFLFLTTQTLLAQAHVYTSTSRSATEIEQNFPFDIELKKADGTVVNSAETLTKSDKPTVLLFWLTTCKPCFMEMAAIQEKYDAWQAETPFNLYAISTDFSRNFEAFAKRVKDSNWPFEAYNDVNREFKEVMPDGLNGLPQVFVLNAAGEIVYHKRRYRPGDEDTLFAEIQRIAKVK